MNIINQLGCWLFLNWNIFLTEICFYNFPKFHWKLLKNTKNLGNQCTKYYRFEYRCLRKRNWWLSLCMKQKLLVQNVSITRYYFFLLLYCCIDIFFPYRRLGIYMFNLVKLTRARTLLGKLQKLIPVMPRWKLLVLFILIIYWTTPFAKIYFGLLIVFHVLYHVLQHLVDYLLNPCFTMKTVIRFQAGIYYAFIWVSEF